jgi:hypothetical protein
MLASTMLPLVKNVSRDIGEPGSASNPDIAPGMNNIMKTKRNPKKMEIAKNLPTPLGIKKPCCENLDPCLLMKKTAANVTIK